jgi:hypothetical protein
MAAIKRGHRRKREEPLVSIDGARVRAAIEWKRLSVNGAASRMQVSQQTLDSIVRGKTTRCYQSLRDKLAGLLELPAVWIGGETDVLPTLTAWLPYPVLGNQSPLWVDENMRLLRPPAGGDLTQRSTLPPRYQLAAHELCTQIVQAWNRGKAEAQAALSQLAVGQWKDRPWDRAMMLVTRLVSAFWWRRLFLRSAPPPVAVDPTRFTDAEWHALGEGMMLQNRRRAAEELDADDKLAASAASALATALRPWFADERELNYGSLTGVLEWASAGFGLVA